MSHSSKESDGLSGRSPAGAEAADPLVGHQVGDFAIVERIAAGPTSVVYKARQGAPERTVALKFVPEGCAQDGRTLSRFRREARAAGAVTHPNVLVVHSVGCEDGRRFIVMEYVEGESLAAALERDGPVAGERALPLMRELAAALAQTHDAGIIHCDIQPSNILITPRGHVKLVDFGLARHVGENTARKTPTEFLEAPLYYPPEAARARPLDPRSDLYLLGGTFYHILAGRAPFDGAGAEKSALRYVRENIPLLNHILPTAPAALCRLVHRLLRRDPDDRYQSAAQVLDALGRIEAILARGETEPASPRRPPAAPPREEPSDRTDVPEATRKQKRIAAIAAGAAALILAIVVGLLLRGSWRPARTDPAPAPAPGDTVAPRRPQEAVEPPLLVKPPARPLAAPIFLRAAKADIHGDGARYEKDEGRDNIGFWSGIDTYVSWTFDVPVAGEYEVQIVYAGAPDTEGNAYAVAIGTHQIESKVRPTGDWGNFVGRKLGTITIDAVGRHTLSVHPITRPRPQSGLMNLQALILRPLRR